jgi:hypothetical protein
MWSLNPTSSVSVLMYIDVGPGHDLHGTQTMWRVPFLSTTLTFGPSHPPQNRIDSVMCLLERLRGRGEEKEGVPIFLITRRELKNRGRGMKGLVDKSIGIVTRITEVLVKIKTTEPLRLSKSEDRKKPK